MGVFFVADTHFGHWNIVKYCKRNFNSIDEHDKALIDAWNNKVGKDDLVYHLGDFCTWKESANTLRRYREQLNGKIILVRGNHDKSRILNGNEDLFEKITQVEIYHIPDSQNLIFMSHYSHRVWKNSHYNTYHLFGHSHGKLPAFGKSFDCGVDTRKDFSPYSLEEVTNIMETLPNNFNHLKKCQTKTEDVE